MDRAIASLSTPTSPTVTPFQECATYSSCMDCLVTNVCIFLILTNTQKKCVDDESASNNYTGRIRDRLDSIDTCTIDDPFLTDFTLAKFVHDYLITRSNYKRSEPPSLYSNGTTITVSLGITVHSFSMTDTDSLFEVDCKILEEWEDSRLVFKQKKNPAEHMTLAYADSEIWVPPVKIINPNDPKNGTEIITRYDPTHLVRMDSHGKGNWSRFPAILVSKCDLDLYRFPFDGQTCNITLSMGEATSQYDLDLQFSSKIRNNTEHGMSFHEDLEYSNWRMHDWGVNRMETVYSCCPHPFIELVFSFDIQRKSNSLAAIWAMVVLCFLTLLNLIVGCFTPSNKGGLQLNFTVKHFVLAVIILALNLAALISYAIYTKENVGYLPLLVIFLIMNSVIAAFYLAIVSLSIWGIRRGNHVYEPLRKLDSDKLGRWCFSSCGPYDPLPNEAEQEEERAPFVEMTRRKSGNGNGGGGVGGGGGRSSEAGPSFIAMSTAAAAAVEEAQKVKDSGNGKGGKVATVERAPGSDDTVPVAAGVDETVFGEGEVTTTTGTGTGTGGSGDTAIGGVKETVFGEAEVPATGVKDETAKDRSGAAANVASSRNRAAELFSKLPLNGSNGGSGGNGHGGSGGNGQGGNGANGRGGNGGNGRDGNGHGGNGRGGNGHGGNGGNVGGGNGGNGHGASGASGLNVVPNRPRRDAGDETCTREWTTLALFLHRLCAIVNVIGAVVIIAKWG